MRLLILLFLSSILLADNMSDFVSENAQIVYSICRKHLHDHHRSEDCTQEVYLELFEKYFSNDIPLDNRIWKTIAHSRAIDMFRYGKTFSGKTHLQILENDTSTTRPFNCDVYFDVQAIRDFVGKEFDPRQRELFHLYFEEQNNCADIMRSTGTSIRKVQREIVEIKKRLVGAK